MLCFLPPIFLVLFWIFWPVQHSQQPCVGLPAHLHEPARISGAVLCRRTAVQSTAHLLSHWRGHGCPRALCQSNLGCVCSKDVFSLPAAYFLLPSPLPCTCSMGSIHTDQDGHPRFATHLWDHVVLWFCLLAVRWGDNSLGEVAGTQSHPRRAARWTGFSVNVGRRLLLSARFIAAFFHAASSQSSRGWAGSPPGPLEPPSRLLSFPS